MKDANGNDLKLFDRVIVKGGDTDDFWRIITECDWVGGVTVKNLNTGHFLDRSPLNLIKC
jgi:hypothetical protein